jgi:hypothetical protein
MLLAALRSSNTAAHLRLKYSLLNRIRLADSTGGACPIGSQVNVQASSPNCWDGVHLDSSTHRTHLVNPSVLKTDHGGLFLPATMGTPTRFRTFNGLNIILPTPIWSLASGILHPMKWCTAQSPANHARRLFRGVGA